MKYAIFATVILVAAVFARADDQPLATIIADVEEVDMKRGELHVLPVSGGEIETGGRVGRSGMVTVRLKQVDSYFTEPQEKAFPVCLGQGKRVRIVGKFVAESTVLAYSVQTIYSSSEADKTGVRSRINRKNGRCGLLTHY